MIGAQQERIQRAFWDHVLSVGSACITDLYNEMDGKQEDANAPSLYAQRAARRRRGGEIWIATQRRRIHGNSGGAGICMHSGAVPEAEGKQALMKMHVVSTRRQGNRATTAHAAG